MKRARALTTPHPTAQLFRWIVARLFDQPAPPVVFWMFPRLPVATVTTTALRFIARTADCRTVRAKGDPREEWRGSDECLRSSLVRLSSSVRWTAHVGTPLSRSSLLFSGGVLVGTALSRSSLLSSSGGCPRWRGASSSLFSSVRWTAHVGTSRARSELVVVLVRWTDRVGTPLSKSELCASRPLCARIVVASAERKAGFSEQAQGDVSTP